MHALGERTRVCGGVVAKKTPIVFHSCRDFMKALVRGAAGGNVSEGGEEAGPWGRVLQGAKGGAMEEFVNE
jgi:hypothetical protein